MTIVPPVISRRLPLFKPLMLSLEELSVTFVLPLLVLSVSELPLTAASLPEAALSVTSEGNSGGCISPLLSSEPGRPPSPKPPGCIPLPKPPDISSVFVFPTLPVPVVILIVPSATFKRVSAWIPS